MLYLDGCTFIFYIIAKFLCKVNIDSDRRRKNFRLFDF